MGKDSAIPPWRRGTVVEKARMKSPGSDRQPEKPNPKTKRDQKMLLDDAFAGLGNAFTGSTDTTNT